MTAIVSLLMILTLSLVVTRIATVALVHTGLSRETAQFQARSAFSGVGFTTRESESIVNHPVRRRVTMVLMLLGNAGIITAVASLLLGLIRTGASGPSVPLRLLVLALGLIVLWIVASSRWVDRRLSRWISLAIERWTNLEIRDYASLLHLADNYQILEMSVAADDWVANRSLSELALSDEGIIVIGIQRADGSYVAAPVGRTRIEPRDLLLLYGRDDVLKSLDTRRCGAEGDALHREAAAEHERAVREQSDREEQRQTKDEA